ncbi:hypothetical protein KEM55_008803, partial [Ascosphaera atra]
SASSLLAPRGKEPGTSHGPSKEAKVGASKWIGERVDRRSLLRSMPASGGC